MRSLVALSSWAGRISTDCRNANGGGWCACRREPLRQWEMVTMGVLTRMWPVQPAWTATDLVVKPLLVAPWGGVITHGLSRTGTDNDRPTPPPVYRRPW